MILLLFSFLKGELLNVLAIQQQILSVVPGNRSLSFFSHQMVGIRRVSGLKNPAEMTYYIQHNGIPLLGSSAAKILNTVDSQTMALTLGYFVQLQAERKHSICLFDN